MVLYSMRMKLSDQLLFITLVAGAAFGGESFHRYVLRCGICVPRAM